MEHLVRFTTAEGKEGHHYADGLDGALAFVERLRNNEEADHVQVYRLSEVKIEFKAYYKVEVSGEGQATEPSVAEEAPTHVAEGTADNGESSGLPTVPPEPDSSSRRLFVRS